MKNFHVPLAEHTCLGLMAEAERTGVPATTLAREAVDWWLRQQTREARHSIGRAKLEKKPTGR